MKILGPFIVAVIAYLAVGSVVCLVHPRLVRKQLGDLKYLDVGRAGFVLKPLMGLAVFALFCVFWPIAWFNAGKSEKKAEEALAARMERLRPFAQLYAAANSPVRYAGGDGSSFESAVVILGANMLSGVRAEYDYIHEHHPGYELRKQSLKEDDGRKFDVLELVGAAGDDRVLYFDISGFHGKPPTTINNIAEKLTSSVQL